MPTLTDVNMAVNGHFIGGTLTLTGTLSMPQHSATPLRSRSRTRSSSKAMARVWLTVSTKGVSSSGKAVCIR